MYSKEVCRCIRRRYVDVFNESKEECVYSKECIPKMNLPRIISEKLLAKATMVVPVKMINEKSIDDLKSESVEQGMSG
jgi:hypothetical protein